MPYAACGQHLLVRVRRLLGTPAIQFQEPLRRSILAVTGEEARRHGEERLKERLEHLEKRKESLERLNSKARPPSSEEIEERER